MKTMTRRKNMNGTKENEMAETKDCPFCAAVSSSIQIAAYDMGLDFVGYEIDKEYFDKQEERFARHTAQMSLFVD